ncbi:MAG: hypothetical protein ABIJ09_23240 [Pseudomonadota bacterium]
MTGCPAPETQKDGGGNPGSDAASSDAAYQDSANADAGSPDMMVGDSSTTADATTADVVVTDGRLPDTATADTATGDVTAADVASVDVAAADVTSADVAAADAATPDSASLDAGTGTEDAATGIIRVLDTDSQGSGMDTNARMIALGNKVVFQGPAQSIWVSDGTEQGTVVLIDQNINLETWTVFNDTLYIIQSGYPWPSYYLWETDGTPGGTSNQGLLQYGGANLDLNGTFLVAGTSRLYVEGSTAAEGGELFRFGLPLSNVEIVLNDTPGTDSTNVNLPYLYSGKLLMEIFNTTVNGYGAYDIAGGSVEMLTFDFGGGSHSPAPSVVFEYGSKLWVCDEGCVTTDGTQAVTALALANTQTNEVFMVEDNQVITANGSIFFRGTQYDSSMHVVVEHEIFKSDGTFAGTSLLIDLNDTGHGNPREFLGGDQHFVFLADVGSTPGEMWISDGTLAGTYMVAEANPGPTSSNIQSKAIIGDKVIFHANDGVTGNELFEYDISAKVTTLIEDKNPGAASLDPKTFVVAGNCLFFRGTVAGYGSELCVYCPLL